MVGRAGGSTDCIMRAFGPPSTAGPVQAPPARPGPAPLAGRATPQAPTARRDVLQRDVVQRDVTDDKDFATAAGDPNRRRDAVVYLGTHPDAARTAKLDLATVEALLPLVGATEHTARGALLERGFVITTKENPNWEKAVGFVMVLDDPGIVRNVATLTDKEAKLLAKGARLAGRAGDQRLMDPIRKKIRREAPGQLFGTVTHKMEPHDGVYNRWGGNGMFSCKMRIEFEPDPDVCEATSIAFVQTVSMLAGKKSVDNRDDMPGRFNSKKQGIDRPDKSKSGFYSSSGGSFNKLTGYSGVQPGISSGGTMVPAIMVDTPDGTTADVTYSYETSIVAKEGTDAGFVYAVVLWSFKVDAAMKVVPNPVELKQVPTADFGAAVTAWNTQAAANKKSGQQALPVQRVAAHLPAPLPVPQPQRDPRMPDTASRARWAATLQRAAGNRASGALMASVQRCGGTVHDGCACADDAVQRLEKGPFAAAREEFVLRDEQR
jgi:hypothetical protein